MATVIKILTQQEIAEFDAPPIFDNEYRKKFLRTNQDIMEILEPYEPYRKAGFLLQLGYFRATGKFYRPSRYHLKDIDYIRNRYGWSFAVGKYSTMFISRDRKKIVELLQFSNLTENKAYFFDEINRCVIKNMRPRRIILHVAEQLHSEKIEIPNYYTFAKTITKTILSHENKLIDCVQRHISKEMVEMLETILKSKSDLKTCHAVFKNINHSCKPKKIRKAVKDFLEVESLYTQLLPLIKKLDLPRESLRYYATWATKSRKFQLQQFKSEYKRCFHLITFVCHQYFVRQDVLIDLMLSGVNSRNNRADKTIESRSFETKKKYEQTVKVMIDSRRSYKEIVDKIKEIAHDPKLSEPDKIELIQHILKTKPPETSEQLQLFEDFEEKVDGSIKGLDYFDLLETMSTSFQNRASTIIQAITFNKKTSNTNIIKAIDYFKKSDGKISKSAPVKFLSKEEEGALYSNEGVFRHSLYKVFLIQHVFDAIKSGELSLSYSYKYLSLDEYLISKSTWEKNKDDLLKKAGLEEFKDIKKVLALLKKELDEGYRITNKNILNKQNLHVRVSKKGRLIIETPKEDDDDPQPKVSALFEKAKFVSILKLLSDVNQASNFTSQFEHFSIKHSKKTPNEAFFIGGSIGHGCNIGTHKMARISKGLSGSRLDHVVDWYFSLENINAADTAILKTLNQLQLPKIYLDELIHTSSDTMRCGVTVDTIYSDRSLKYFQYGTGVKINSFLDPKSALFYSHVINSSEGEAPYMIDAFLNNDVVKSDIHSTDTHGYSEVIFAATHFCGVYFAPRIKNVQKQSLYSFLPRAHYVQKGDPVLPKQALNISRIEDNWDDTLRLMATIKLKHTSASQIFKRLNSYSKNPLYMGLKEYGRIIKSIFILRYIDDVELRQRIDSQLNKSELSNKFARAVRFANNQDFNVATREEQNIADACRRLIQNAIVLWNYLYLSESLLNMESQEKRDTTLNIIREGSMMVWSHINLHGEYNFSSVAKNQAPFFDVPKIMTLRLP